MTGLPPGYVRPPWSAERKAAHSRLLKSRFASPGYRRVYNVAVPEARRDEIVKAAMEFRHIGGHSFDETREFVFWLSTGKHL